MSEFKEIVKNLPLEPGVYRFYSQSGDLLYIGKAKNLKNRVSSYFQNARDKSQRTRLMVSQINRVEYTVVKTEKESIILESNLIHSLQPRYNIQLKDDRSYVYVRLTSEPTPRLLLNRRKFDPKSRYFGPYTRKFSIQDVLRTLRIIFPNCAKAVPDGKPCEYVSLRQCDGICHGGESLEYYQSKIEQISNVLSGRTEIATNWLKNKIKEAAESSNFELAGLWRDRLKILESTVSDQKIVLPQPQDIDLITLVMEQNSEGLQIGSVFVQSIQNGKIVNVINFLLSGNEDEGWESNKQNSQALAMSMLQRFIKNYTAERNCLSPIFVQVFEKQV